MVEVINKFENLDAWKTAKSLASDIYRAVAKYPKHEIFALTNQTTRAVVSISANIAEGSSRSSKKDFCHFLEIALGSAFEVKTLLEIAKDLDYITPGLQDDLSCKVMRTIKLIYGLKRSINE